MILSELLESVPCNIKKPHLTPSPDYSSFLIHFHLGLILYGSGVAFALVGTRVEIYSTRRNLCRSTNMTIKTHLALAAVTIAGLATISGAWAAPSGVHGNSSHSSANHGSVVSSTARTKTEGTKHGQVVSTVAKSKHQTTQSTSYHSSSYKKGDYRTNSHKVKTTQLKDAARLRNQAIRQAQNSFAVTRKSILQDREEKRLSTSERERLQAAIRTRNEAIRNAQNQYRVTTRSIR
jgi:hypothetical protein